MPVKRVTSPSSAPQVTFRQATLVGWGGVGGGGALRGGGIDIFWNYTIQKKCNFPAQNIVRCLLFLVIVDKFATHTLISRHTLCLIISTQFTTD